MNVVFICETHITILYAKMTQNFYAVHNMRNYSENTTIY